MNDEIEKLHRQLPENVKVEEYINTGKGPQIGHADTLDLTYQIFTLIQRAEKWQQEETTTIFL